MDATSCPDDVLFEAAYLFLPKVMELRSQDDVMVLCLGSDENRFNPTFIDKISHNLDLVEQNPKCKALVITANGKFFSNGLDLEWVAKNRDKVKTFLPAVFSLFSRLVVFRLPTIAALNGHAFGAGIFLALACDWRVMRKDRGFLNFPEVNLGLPLDKFKFLVTKLPPLAQRTVLTGEKIDAQAALNYGIVDYIEPEENLVPRGIKLALSLSGKSPDNYSQLKKELWGNIHEGLAKL